MLRGRMVGAMTDGENDDATDPAEKLATAIEQDREAEGESAVEPATLDEAVSNPDQKDVT
jgi:hypothetical protein